MNKIVKHSEISYAVYTKKYEEPYVVILFQSIFKLAAWLFDSSFRRFVDSIDAKGRKGAKDWSKC